MTKGGDFKKIVRARMARTGERYAAARAQLASQPAASACRGGHPESSALVRVLAAAGITGPDRAPITESLVLGLGGGIGAAWFVFEYKGHPPQFYLATRCQPQYAYDPAFITTAAERLGAACDVAETTSATVAANHLRERTARGPVIAWVDRAALPWSTRPTETKLDAMPHVVVVDALGDGSATIRDTHAVAFELPVAELATARKRLRNAKHRLVSVGPGASIDPRAAIAAAIAACAAELGGRSKIRGPMASNFGIAALRRWLVALTDPKLPKRFSKVFSPPHALAFLAWGRYWIDHAGTGGGGFRPMYAEFLESAATIANRPTLRPLAKTYRNLGAEWTALATAMLPDSIPGFAAVRHAQDVQLAAFVRGDVAALRVAEVAGWAAAKAAPKLDAETLRHHYADLAARLAPILDAEDAAARALAAS